MSSQLQNVSSVDIYYICQMVDNITREPGRFIRHIEDIFGDAGSSALTTSFPKYTCFHHLIEEIISSVIWEQAGSRYEVEVEGRGLWIDDLIQANDDLLIRDDWADVASFKGPVDEYLVYLSEIGVVDQVCELLSQQVFHVLFANRLTLRSFGLMTSGYVLNTAPFFSPSSFTSKGVLRRTSIPQWVKDAVFHRDKGRCVFCRADMTKIYSKQSKVHFDHIVPLARGGMNCVTNLQLCCESCNLKKGAREDNTSFLYEPWF